MSIGRRVIILAGTCLVFLVAMIGLMAFALQSAGHFAQRGEGLDRRLAVLAELKADANAYAEKIAAVLLLGRGELDALGAARIRMERGFAELTRTTREEIATLGNAAEIQGELPEVEDSRRMLELYHDIDSSANRALALQRSGAAQQAAELFREQVEFRVLNELLPLIDSGLEGELGEANGLAASVGQSQSQALVGAVVLALFAVAALVLAVFRLRRGLDRKDKDFAADLKAQAAQLEQARRLLGETDSRQAQFLADIGHELRTPLTVLRGEADVALRARGEAGEQRQALERIRGQAAELGQLLEDLIAYARSDGESQPDRPVDTRLDEVVKAATQEGEVLAETRELGIVLRLADNGCYVNADFRRLKQALMIGLDNAVKHSAPGGTIEVETAIEAERATIRIMDQGPGVLPDDEPRVFERFYRGRAEADSLTQGLGIGLAIAKEIIERHQGGISLGNRSGGGAVLEMTLPLAGKPTP